MSIDYSHGASADYFGHKDYWAALDEGKSSTEVYDWLKQNKDKVRMDNVQGKDFGLYEQVRRDAVRELDKKPEPAPSPNEQTITNNAGPGNPGVRPSQLQNVIQDNDISSNVQGNNNTVTNSQDNSVKQYGGATSWKNAWMQDYFS